MDFASPLIDQASKSVYKLDMSEPGKSMHGSFPGAKIKRSNNPSPMGSGKGRGNV